MMPAFSSLPSEYCLAPMKPSKLFQLLTSTIPASGFLSCLLHVAWFLVFLPGLSLLSFQAKQSPQYMLFPPSRSFSCILVYLLFCLGFCVINTSPKCFREKGIKYVHVLRCSIVISFVISHVILHYLHCRLFSVKPIVISPWDLEWSCRYLILSTLGKFKCAAF